MRGITPTNNYNRPDDAAEAVSRLSPEAAVRVLARYLAELNLDSQAVAFSLVTESTGKAQYRAALLRQWGRP